MKAKNLVHSFLRVFVQTRSRGHTAVGAACYRLALAGLSLFRDKSGNRRRYDYRGRRDIMLSGCALPPGAHAVWGDPLHWALEIEKFETRKNSRLFRDDVVAIPWEVKEAGLHRIALARYASRIAIRRQTPVHFVIHAPHRGSDELHDSHPGNENIHGHVMYGGRRLKENGRGFEAKRDREQDKDSLVVEHKGIWKDVLAELGFTVDFSGPVSLNPRPHLGPKWAALERVACEEEAVARLIQSVELADSKASELDAWTRRALGSIISDLDSMTVTSLIDRDHPPRTRAVRAAQYQHSDSESARMRRFSRALRDELVRVGEDCIAGKRGIEKGFSVMRSTAKTNIAAIALVRDRQSWLWDRLRGSQRRRRCQDRQGTDRALEWRKWCERKFDPAYKQSLAGTPIEWWIASRRKTKRRSSRAKKFSDNWTNAHVLSLEATALLWRQYCREKATQLKDARKVALAKCAQAIALEVVRAGEERIQDGLRENVVPEFRTFAENQRDNAVAVGAMDECMSILFGRDLSPTNNETARAELVKRWRRRCSMPSKKPGEEGLTYGQAIARVVAVRVLGRRWERGAVTEAVLRAVKDEMVAKLEGKKPREERKARTRQRPRRPRSIGE